MGGIMAPKDIMTNTHAKSILNSMNSLRKSNTLCDVTLRVEQKDFPAHRIVLAACSDYFCAMFTSEVNASHCYLSEIRIVTLQSSYFKGQNSMCW
jgi:kelch-like protein 12